MGRDSGGCYPAGDVTTVLQKSKWEPSELPPPIPRAQHGPCLFSLFDVLLEFTSVLPRRAGPRGPWEIKQERGECTLGAFGWRGQRLVIPGALLVEG